MPTRGSRCSWRAAWWSCRTDALAQLLFKDGDEATDKAWMSVWVDDVDAVHRQSVAPGLDVTFPPTKMPGNVRQNAAAAPANHKSLISIRPLRKSENRPEGFTDNDQSVPTREEFVIVVGLGPHPREKLNSADRPRDETVYASANKNRRHQRLL